MGTFVFAGADHKVGVTQIVHALGNKFAELYTDKRVLILPLDGKRGTDYINMPFVKCIDDIRAKTLSGVLMQAELLDACVQVKNLFIIQGSRLANPNKLYTPEFAEKLVVAATDFFDVILVDAGADEKSALSIGAVQLQADKVLITTQQHLSNRYFDLKVVNVFATLEICFRGMIINKYLLDHRLPNDTELNSKYNLEALGIITMADDPVGWIAEAEKSILSIYSAEFDRGIAETVGILAKMCGFNEPQHRAKNTLLSRIRGRRAAVGK